MRNNVKKNLLLLVSLLSSSALFGALGCITNDYHRQKDPFYDFIDPSLRETLVTYRNEADYQDDPKAWHAIWCTCPCNKYLAKFHSNKIDAGGLCPICGHRGHIGRAAQERTVVPKWLKVQDA